MLSIQGLTRRIACGVALVALAAPLAGQGLAPTDRGWYSVAGNHNTWNSSYFLGNASNTNDFYYRDFFVFDLSCAEGPITSASLEVEVWVGSYQSADPSETFVLFDVTTSHAALVAGTDGVATYADLGQGVPYGSAVVSLADEGSIVSIPLNASAIADMNAALGGTFALGGAITTLDGDDLTAETLFAGSQGLAVRLVFDPSCDTRDATARGQYTDLGSSQANAFYSVGNWANVAEIRNFFAFDVADVEGLVTGAVVALEHPYSPVSDDPSETYTLFDVDTALADLVDGTALVDGFDDLGSGTAYGSYELTSADAATLVKVELDPAGLAALNEALGGVFTVGGAITTLDADPATVEAAFGNNLPAHTITQLMLTVEPRWGYLGPGLAGTGGLVPLLTGTGELLGGDPASVQLVQALPGASAWFVSGFTQLGLPLKGGVLYPQPQVLVGGIPVAPDGTITLDTVWPVGAPSGVSVHYQFWVVDPAGPVGFAASNGLRSTTP